MLDIYNNSCSSFYRIKSVYKIRRQLMESIVLYCVPSIEICSAYYDEQKEWYFDTYECDQYICVSSLAASDVIICHNLSNIESDYFSPTIDLISSS